MGRLWRRTLVVVASLGLLAGAVLAVVFVRAGERSELPTTYVSAPGGIEVWLPPGWSDSTDEDPDPNIWLVAERARPLGPADQWMWVHRATAASGDALDLARQAALADITRRYGRLGVEEDRFHWNGRAALRLRYTRPTDGPLRVIPGNRVEEIRVITTRAGQVYELGFGGWRGLADESERILDRVRWFEPVGTRRVHGPGFTLTLPASFNVRQPPFDDAPTAGSIASAPDQWVMLWAFDDPIERTLADSLAAARRSGQVSGQRAVRMAGRDATRIDFTQLVDGRPATFVTWHLTGAAGRSWQVLVGGHVDLSLTASLVERTLHFAAQGR